MSSAKAFSLRLRSSSIAIKRPRPGASYVSYDHGGIPAVALRYRAGAQISLILACIDGLRPPHPSDLSIDVVMHRMKLWISSKRDGARDRPGAGLSGEAEISATTKRRPYPLPFCRREVFDERS